MNFKVEWLEEVEDQLADLWVTAVDKSAGSEASRRADQLLALDPANQGEQRDGEDRLVFIPPLALFFRADTQAFKVWVISVGWSGRPV